MGFALGDTWENNKGVIYKVTRVIGNLAILENKLEIKASAVQDTWGWTLIKKGGQ